MLWGFVSQYSVSAGSLENLGPISREALIERPLIVSGCIGDSTFTTFILTGPRVKRQFQRLLAGGLGRSCRTRQTDSDGLCPSRNGNTHPRGYYSDATLIHWALVEFAPRLCLVAHTSSRRLSANQNATRNRATEAQCPSRKTGQEFDPLLKMHVSPTRALKIAEQKYFMAVAEAVHITGEGGRCNNTDKEERKMPWSEKRHCVATCDFSLFVCLFTLGAAERTKRAPFYRHRLELGPCLLVPEDDLPMKETHTRRNWPHR